MDDYLKNTDRRQLQKIREKNSGADDKVHVQSMKDEEVKVQLEEQNPSQYSFATVRLKPFGWVVPQTDFYNPSWYTWKFEIPKFDIRHLPYLTINFVLKTTVVQNIEQIETRVIEDPHKGIYFYIEDIEGLDPIRAEYVKKVTVCASLYTYLMLEQFPNSAEGEPNHKVYSDEGIDNGYEFYPVIAIPVLAIYR